MKTPKNNSKHILGLASVASTLAITTLVLLISEPVTKGAAVLIDSVDILQSEVDSVALQGLFGYRGTSSLLTFTGDPSWVSLDSCITGSEQFGGSDGYWVMLAPLKPGAHTIHIRGGISAFGFEVNVTYHLTVTP